MTDKSTVTALVTEQLSRIADTLLTSRVRDMLVEPHPVARDWDYGVPGQKFICWTVIEHPASSTGIAYCGEGFGPSYPWGLVWLSGAHMNIGMDSAWYASLEDAFRESMAWDGANPADYEVT